MATAAAEVETGEGMKRQLLEKRLERRVKKHAKLLNKDHAKILRLKRAMDEEVVVGITEPQQDQMVSEATSKGGQGHGGGRIEAGGEQRRWRLSPEAISYLANYQPVRYGGIPDSELVMMLEAPQALEREIRALCDRIYQEDISIQQQCLLKGYVEM